MDRGSIESKLRARLEADPRILCAWLFGSVARATHNADSDIDLAVLTTAGGVVDPLLLEADLTQLLARRVQLVDVRTAPVDLVHRVLRDGILLLERDRSARVAFEVDARNRYFDMRPVLLEYRRPRGAA